MSDTPLYESLMTVVAAMSHSGYEPERDLIALVATSVRQLELDAKTKNRNGLLPDCMMPDGAEPCLGYRQLDDQLIRWFKAASPYATPGSLEEGLKKLREELIEECALICESRAGEGQYAESQAAWRILISAARAIRALKNFQPDGPIGNTVKPSAWG